jgi:hypothetical protein
MYDGAGKKRNGWYVATFANLRYFDLRYLDVLGTDGWMYKPVESTDTTESIYDAPQVKVDSQWVKSVAEFDSFLICQTSETDCNGNAVVKWKPAFQVSWTATAEYPNETRVYQVSSGNSISTLPNYAAVPQWPYDNKDIGGETGYKPGPLEFLSNPTF